MKANVQMIEEDQPAVKYPADGEDAVKDKIIIRMVKNYHRQVECDRCSKWVRDDRLRAHQMSRQCKSKKLVWTIDESISKSVENLLKSGGFKVKDR
jgi:hypothetical protein